MGDTDEASTGGPSLGDPSEAEESASTDRQATPLHRGSDRYRELFERSADAILIIKNGRFVDCNQAAVEMLRYDTRDQVFQTHPSELSPPFQPDGRDSHEKADEMIATAFANGNHRFEWDHKRADGEVFPVEVLLTAAGEGEDSTLHVVWRDITERKLLEEQLLQSQKMQAIGQLAGGIAHDFNNLLVAMIGHCDLLEISVSDRPDLLNHIKPIQRSATRAASLVRQLLTFSRKQPVQQQIVDLNAVVINLEGLLRRVIGEDIKMTIERSDRLVSVKVDPVQIEQVVVNLATNARDAMPSGGTIRIAIGIRTFGVNHPNLPSTLDPGKYALLTVADSGVGMNSETQTRAFEPFFTTKDVGRGTGLGLSTAYGIIKQSRGDISIESEPTKGTTIRVFLPLADDEVFASQLTPPTAAAGGDERILVVEDEESVAKLVINVLRSSGYEVHSARDGLEALGVWELNGGRFDLILSDVVMPNMGGVQMVEELNKLGFRPKVLFMSGYTANLAPDLIKDLEEEADLLQKPFRTSELISRVRSALDAPTG